MSLLFLIIFPLGCFYQHVRQQQLNHGLIVAAKQNDTAAVRNLLYRGADPNAPILPDDSRSFWQRLLDILWNKTSPRPRIHDSALLEAVNWVPKRESASQSIPSAIIDNADIVQALVDAGAKVNIRADENATPLIHDGDKNATPLIAAACFHKFETVKVLLAHNADINAADEKGDTALIYAAYAKNAEIVETLLEKGANVNARDTSGDTALIVALFPGQANVEQVRETVKCLLRQGASIHDIDINGYDAMAGALYWQDKRLIRMLKQSYAR